MTTGAPTQNMPKGPLFLRYATFLNKLLCIFAIFYQIFQRCGPFVNLTYTIKHTGVFLTNSSKLAKIHNDYWYVIIYVIESLTSHGYKQNEIS